MQITDEEKNLIDEKYNDISIKSEIMQDFVLLYHDYIHKYHNYGTKGNVHKLSMMEIHTLTMIEKTPGITVSELAEKWGKTNSALSQTVARLEQYGYVIKERDKENPKMIQIFVSDIGENLSYNHKLYDIENAKRKRGKFAERSSPERVEDFYEMLKIYTQIIKEEE